MAKAKKDAKPKSLPFDWTFPEGLVSRYANNIIVQHSQNEFIISFFEARPPLLIGTLERIERVQRETKSLSAECVARIVVSPQKMRDFVKVMTRNMETYEAKFGSI
jgi:hypothetical protein